MIRIVKPKLVGVKMSKFYGKTLLNTMALLLRQHDRSSELLRRRFIVQHHESHCGGVSPMIIIK